MTEAKYSLPVTSAVPPILSLTSDDAHTQVYKTLGLPQEYIRFLEFPKKENLLSEFEVGNNRIKIYGSPVHMALVSPLIENIISYSPPYRIADHMTVFGGALTIAWLVLNGFVGALDKIDKLSFKGWLNFFDLVTYLLIPDNMIINEVIGKTNQVLAKRFREARDEELLEYPDRVANLLSKVMARYKGQSMRNDRIGEALLRVKDIDQISKGLTYIPVFYPAFVSGDEGLRMEERYFGSVDRKAAESDNLVSELVNLGAGVTGDSLHLRSVGAVEIVRYPNRILLLNKEIAQNPAYSDMIKIGKIVLKTESASVSNFPVV